MPGRGAAAGAGMTVASWEHGWWPSQLWCGSSHGGPDTPEGSIILVLRGHVTVCPLCIGRRHKAGEKQGAQEDPRRCWLGEEAVRKIWNWSCSKLVAGSPGPLPMQNSDQGLRAPCEHVLCCCGLTTRLNSHWRERDCLAERQLGWWPMLGQCAAKIGVGQWPAPAGGPGQPQGALEPWMLVPE